MSVQSTALSKDEKPVKHVKRTSPEPSMQPLLFTRQQVAKLLNVSVMTVIRMEADSRLQAVKLNTGVTARTYYRSADVYALVERRGDDAR
jgi:hypothetical protein